MIGTILNTDTVLLEGPTVPALDIEEVKKQRRFSSTSLDTLFDLWIQAATQHFEEQTGRQLLTSTWEYWLDGFPSDGQIVLPFAPLQMVTSVSYRSGGSYTEVDASLYQVVAPSGPYAGRGRVELEYGGAWPTVSVQPKAVRVEFVAGYGDAPGAVPDLVKAALLFLVGHFHKFGEEVQDAKFALQRLPLGAWSIIAQFAMPPMVAPRSA